MPKYSLTSAWSVAIAVEAGDYVQNQSADPVEICAITPASSSDAIKLPPCEAVLISAATSIRARSTGNWPGDIVVAGGL